MTMQAVQALRADSEALLATAESFTSDDWATPSGCATWSVQDVFTHLINLFLLVVDPTALPSVGANAGTEETQQRMVEARRDLSPAEVLEQYRETSAAALTVLELLQGNEAPLDLGDLGTHPMHLAANAYAFDHYTHIRADLFAPIGPLPHRAPPADDLRLGAALDWMIAGAPQMNSEALAHVGGPVSVTLTGPGGRSVQLLGDGEPVATIESSSADFVLWGTKRRSWRDMPVTICGDQVAGAAFCDALHLYCTNGTLPPPALHRMETDGRSWAALPSTAPSPRPRGPLRARKNPTWSGCGLLCSKLSRTDVSRVGQTAAPRRRFLSS
jgi:uncharacterized protein (TIGR03083 family)